MEFANAIKIYRKSGRSPTIAFAVRPQRAKRSSSSLSHTLKPCVETPIRVFKKFIFSDELDGGEMRTTSTELSRAPGFSPPKLRVRPKGHNREKKFSSTASRNLVIQSNAPTAQPRS